ncbi:MAG: hypothetical protein KC777_27730 [Cyanobacteria bacterium HKST-UBA02]|nr:hypothetical protein [Cyanobacteria bacterium HKST-UBA02]
MSGAREKLVTIALLGTQAQPPVEVREGGELGRRLEQVLSREDRSPESRVLDAAALVFVHDRAGLVLPSSPLDAVNTGEEDAGPVLSEQSAAHLARVMEDFPVLFGSWLAAVADSGYRIPHENLPDLLDFLAKNYKRKNSLPFDQVEKVIGKRGLWLVGLNPEWSSLRSSLGGIVSIDDDEIFQVGAFAERLAYLETLRDADPDRARAMLESTWSEEATSEKAGFLKKLAHNLGPGDEAFLELALADKRKEVRQVASSLLSLLPDSAFSKRMNGRLGEFVEFKKGIFGKKIEVKLPDGLSSDLKKDGLTARQDAGLGEKAGIVSQVLSFVDPQWIVETSGFDPDTLVKLSQDNEWRQALLLGFVEASVRHRHQEFLEALLISETMLPQEPEMFETLEPGGRERVVTAWLKKRNGLIVTAPGNYSEYRRADFIENMEHKWSREFSRLIVDCAEKHLKQDINMRYMVGPVFKAAAAFGDPSIFDSIGKLVDAQAESTSFDDRHLAPAAEIIAIRKQITIKEK